MKKRLSTLLNDLSISLETANKALKNMGKNNGGKEYTLNSSITEEDAEKLVAFINSDSKKKKTKKKDYNPNKDNSYSPKALSFHRMVTAPCGFSSCYAYFMLKTQNYKKLAEIKHEMDKVFGEDASPADFRMARMMNTKGIKVINKYYFFSQTGHKSYIKENKCLLTWIASVFSEAVNKDLMTKVDYHLFFKKFLAQEFGTKNKKRKFKSPKINNWVSVVSVPFGGMNRR